MRSLQILSTEKTAPQRSDPLKTGPLHLSFVWESQIPIPNAGQVIKVGDLVQLGLGLAIKNKKKLSMLLPGHC